MTETIDTIPEHPDEDNAVGKSPFDEHPNEDNIDEKSPRDTRPHEGNTDEKSPFDEAVFDKNPNEENPKDVPDDKESSKEENTKPAEGTPETKTYESSSDDNAVITPPIEEKKERREKLGEKININNDPKIVTVELSVNPNVKYSPEIVCEPKYADRLPSGKRTPQNFLVSTPKRYTPPFLPVETASPPISSKRSFFIRFKRCIFFIILTATVFGYAIGGAYLFSSLEMQRVIEYNAKIDKWKNDTAILLATELRQVVPYEEVWARTVFQYLEVFEKDLLKAAAVGYRRLDDEDRDQRWSWTSSFFFSMALMTTTGYGSMTPRSKFGRPAVVLYSILGVPLAFFWFMIVGYSLAVCWISLFRNICCRLCGEDPKLNWEDVFLRAERDSPKLLKVRSNSVAPIDEQHLIPQGSRRFNHSTKIKLKKRQTDFDARFTTRINHSTSEKNRIVNSTSKYARQVETELDEISKIYRSTEYAMAIIYSILFFIVYYVFGSIWLSILEGWLLLDTMYFNFLMFMTLGPGCHELENDNSEIKMKSRLCYSIFLCIGYCILSMSVNLVYLMYRGKGKYQKAVLKIETLKMLSQEERY